MKSLSQYRLIVLSSVFFTLFYNFSFFNNIIKTYNFSGLNIVYTLRMVILLISLFTFILTIFSSKYTTKPILIFLFIISAFVAYFMDSYGVVIDKEMIRNSLQTNLNESLDLFSFKLVLYVVILAILPTYFIYKIKISYKSFKAELFSKIKTIILSFLMMLVLLLSFSKFYSSFLREHKPLRYSVNPTFWIYSTVSYISKSSQVAPKTLQTIGNDSKVVEPATNQKELIILVVGESARADRFSINGYERKTNPLLEKENIINFSNMYSCGTSTAYSVPCMFSVFGKESYDYEKGISTQNILDVLKNTKEISILWRDNNSDSKGVALRVDYEDYRTSKTNTICDDGECRDEGMLVGLDDYIKKHEDKDILIVLHQMGSHGPAYYKRYTKEFEKFTPTCKTNQLEDCTQEEIENAYDNTILYTDYFLSKAIDFLKPYSKTHETALIYMSDHGESLGENGIYLHGMPYPIAPDAQKKIGSFIWLGDGEISKEIDRAKLESYKDKEFSQDNLFHTLLGLFEVETDIYKKDMDILNDARKPE